MKNKGMGDFVYVNGRRNLLLKIVLASSMLSIQATVYSQNFKDRLLAMQQEYTNMNNVHVVMNIQAFENELSTVSFYKESAVIKREGKNYLSQFSGMDMLMNDKYLLMVDRHSKQIICAKRDSKAEVKFFDPVKVNLDSILGFYGTPLLVQSENQVEQFRLDQKKGPIKVIDVYIDTNKNVLKRLDYRYEDGQYVVIQFEVFDTAPVFGSAEFQESNYVVPEKGKLKPSSGYSNFNVVVN